MLWNPLFKGSESLWQQNSFTESCCVCQRRWASRTCCRWCCWWMTATSCDMELTAFKSAKGCELIATALVGQVYQASHCCRRLSRRPATFSLREEVSWMWQNILQVCCNRFQAVPQHAWAKRVACCHLVPCDCAWNSPPTISTTKRVNTCWIPSPVTGRIHATKTDSCTGFCSERACAASCSGFSFRKKHLKIGNAFCSDLF